MLTVELSAGDIGRIRFGLSCLWEVASSFHVLRSPREHAVHLPWARRVGPRLAAAGLAPGGGSLLDGLIPPGPRYMPDFLTPPPATLAPQLDAELEVLRATPAETVRAELDLLQVPHSPAVCAMYADPPAGLARLVEEIRAYWPIALAEEWPRLRALLEAEVFHRARLLAEVGAAGLLNSLHDRVGWNENTLSVAHGWCSGATVVAGAGLLLVPSVFVWPAVRTVASPSNPQLAYPPRGVGTLWESASAAPQALAAVIGRSRAQLLVELESPLSTTELARRTGLSAGGISQHLGALRTAGLISAHRAGHAVLNMRTATADALIAAAVTG
ncbi:DUF5937 family protein [Micromonospora sp. NPDC049559]|uniref:DUF5937 family protein n=1 Tax=Micromonospora sp. NPDC049559 TaxID=3155923 RepID=UPI00342514A0